MAFEKQGALPSSELALPAGPAKLVDGADGQPTLHVPGFVHDLEWTPEEEKRVRRKLDTYVLPMTMFLFIWMQIDRQNVGSALTDTIIRDLGTTLDVVGNLSLVAFILGFVVMEVPFVIMAKRVGPNRIMPVWCALWGVSVMAMGFTRTGAQLVGVRFLVGFFEAGFIPTSVYYLSRFYTTREIGVRYAILFQANSVAAIIAAAIAYGLLGLSGTLGHPGWRWLFWIEGGCTIFVAILSAFVLPRNALHTKKLWAPKGWLDEREGQIAVTRVVRDDPSKARDSVRLITSLGDIKATFSNWLVWCHLAIGFFGAWFAYPFNSYAIRFLRQVPVLNRGYIPNLAIIPAYAMGIIWSVGMSWNSDRTGERGLHIAAGGLMAMVGNIWLAAVPIGTPGGVLYAAVLFTAPHNTGALFNCLNAAWVTGSIPASQRHLVFAALLMVINCTAFLQYGTFPARWAPRYRQGFGIVAAGSFISILFALFLKFWYRAHPPTFKDDVEERAHLKIDDHEIGDRGDRHSDEKVPRADSDRSSA